MMNERLNQLLQYGIKHQLIQSDDVYYAVNRLLKILNSDIFKREIVEDLDYDLIMKDLIDYAFNNNIITINSTSERDAFEAQIIDCLLPRPSELNRLFRNKYKKSPQQATKFFHDLSIHSNYIKLKRIEKNLNYKYPSKYADLDITINLAKPEKDPLEIKKANTNNDQYPKCPICMENVGMYQTPSLDPRMNHRAVSITVNNEKDAWAMHYSPYAYFNEHLIVLRKEHTKMYVNDKTFEELVDFVNKFPHYLIGSNAGLPIVGGSILSHHHFQGGRYDFPIEKARVLKKYKTNRVTIEVLDWPMSTIRLVGNNENRLLDVAHYIFENWKKYNNEALQIYAHTNEDHNTVTPIVKLDGLKFNFYMVFRNNYSSKDLPFGLFHPRPDLFHIKKENIGLIEVMGLAILPGRLKEELEMIKEVISLKKDIFDYPELSKHSLWIESLKSKELPSDIDEYLKMEIGKKFEQILEDCNVFKFGEQKDFISFIEKAI